MAPPLTTRKLTLTALAWPIFVEQGLRILIGTVDTLMVSHISDGAVAALGVAHQVVVVSLILFNFIGIGSSVVITHHLGAGDRSGADRIARGAIGVNSWIGLAVSALVAFCAEPILRAMQLPEALLPYARPFLTLMGGTLFLEAQNTAMSAALRAHAHTRPVMLVTALQNVVNVVCNAVLLFGLLGSPKLGVPGVAISGVISRLVAFVILRRLVLQKTGVRLLPADYFRLPLDTLRRVLRIGLPAAGENLSYWLALIVVTSFASRMGESSLAAWAYARQITIWVILFAISIGLGTEILVGHLVGSGELERARRELLASLRTGFVLALLVSGGVALAAPFLVGLFTTDPAVVAAAVTLQHLGVLLETGRVFNIVAVNGLRATGDARFPLFMGACSIWGMWVPLAWLLGSKLGLGLTGLCVAMICDEWLRGLLNYGRWKRGGWLEHAKQSREHLASAGREAAAPPALPATAVAPAAAAGTVSGIGAEAATAAGTVSAATSTAPPRP
jgi:putative MATE family efflux protein